MSGPPPKLHRRRRAVPVRGEWRQLDAVGWQHGPVPDPPEGMGPAAVTTWSTWMAGWFAAHWGEADLPGLRQVVRLYDAVASGQYRFAGELRLQMDTYGITPKGQQDRRWRPPEGPEHPPGPVASLADYRAMVGLPRP